MLQIQKTTSNVHKKGNFILLAGKAKNGKTYSMTTLKGKTLILDADEGIRAFAGNDNIDFITINNNSENIIKVMKNALETVEKNLDKYDNIVLDTLTALSKMYLDTYLVGVKDGRQAYGQLNTALYPLVRKFELFAREHGKNVIVTTQIETTFDENEKEIISPSIDGQKALTKILMPRFDGILQLEVRPTGERVFITRSTQKVWAGIRDANGVLEAREPADWSKLFNKLKGN